MKKLSVLLLFFMSVLTFAQSLQPTIGIKYTGGLSYDMEHEYFSGQVGLIYTPKYETIPFTSVKLSGDYIYDYKQEFNGKHNFYVLKMQFAKLIHDDFISFTYYGGYINSFDKNLMKPFKGDLKTNLAWGLGIQAHDDYVTAELLYESLAGYPHVSVGVNFNLWDLLGNRDN